MDDLFQVGCVGLIKAIDNFDIDLARALFHLRRPHDRGGDPPLPPGQQRHPGLPQSMRDTAYRVLQAKEKLMARSTSGSPSVEEIAKELDLPREDVVFAMDAIVDPVSLYEPIYSDGGDTVCVMDQVKDSQATPTRAWMEQIALKEAIKQLGERERRILSLRFYEGKTQMEVSGEVGISQAQVSRLEKNAINTIKKNL